MVELLKILRINLNNVVNMLRSILLVGGFVVLTLLVFEYFSAKEGNAALDEFAQCLSEKGAIMYGADWCPHCQNEKMAFGSSFKFVHYVECPDDPKRCLSAGITGYPTWIFPAGRRFEGEQGLKQLARESGCPFSY